MTAPKYISRAAMEASRWFSRSRWKQLGVIIPADAVPKDHGWKRDTSMQRGFAFPVFSEDQGTRKKPKPVPEVDQLAIEQAFLPADQGSLF
ncbi:MAG TPA: hypothetical protein VIL88_17745 [Devosia sp.]|jgi:exopolysaccharide biosynthesis protein|uniref:hypothetical protein n=1 Tax=Devosia sp. TaxID=1871048 RepID=UPI002F94FBE5